MEINNYKDLEAAILELEKRKVIQEKILKEEFQSTKESLKPMNLIKSSFSKLTHTPEIRDGVFKTIAGVGLGLLTKNMFLGKAIPLVKSLVEKSVEKGVESSISTGVNTVKAYGTAIFNQLFNNKKQHT